MNNKIKLQPKESTYHKLPNGEVTGRSNIESELTSRLLSLQKKLLPEYGDNWSIHSLVALKRIALSRIIYYNNLYEKILEVPGVICEFGVQWGATLALLQNFRGMYEPYNISRKIFGLDTFKGFLDLTEHDGALAKPGDYKSFEGYENTLEEILGIHEQFSPISHIKKFDLIKCDASKTIDLWTNDNPHAIISMAIFDMDVYKPTRDVLEKIIPRLTKGSLLVFDELNCPHFPGETIAIQEILGLNNLKLKRYPHQTYCSYAVFGD
jgi:Macrocin-O-methyltransferase (TylF)